MLINLIFMYSYFTTHYTYTRFSCKRDRNSGNCHPWLTWYDILRTYIKLSSTRERLSKASYSEFSSICDFKINILEIARKNHLEIDRAIGAADNAQRLAHMCSGTPWLSQSSRMVCSSQTTCTLFDIDGSASGTFDWKET